MHGMQDTFLHGTRVYKTRVRTIYMLCGCSHAWNAGYFLTWYSSL